MILTSFLFVSEYQCYQFDAIDRILTPAQRREVSELSSHVSVSASSATVEYNYSDFKHDPVQVLKRYFDLYTYESNWGVQRLVFRFNQTSVDLESIAKFELDEWLTVVVEEDQVLIDCYLDENYDHDLDYDYDGSGFADYHTSRSHFVSFYQEIIEGDYRSLCLWWLKAADFSGVEESGETVIIPDGLGELEGSHRALIRFIGLDSDLLTAVQSSSRKLKKGSRSQGAKIVKLLPLLSEGEVRKYLDKFLCQNPHSVRSELVGRLREKGRLATPQEDKAGDRVVRFSELLETANRITQERLWQEEEKCKRRGEQYVQELRIHRERMWNKVTEFIERKKTKYYEFAILTLSALKFLAEYEDQLFLYYQKADAITERYPRLSGLQWRLKAAEVVSQSELPDRYYYTMRRERWHSENPPEKEYLFSLLNE